MFFINNCTVSCDWIILKRSKYLHRYLQMPLSLYIAEDGQKRMIEKTAKNVATSRATTLRTDRYYLEFWLLFSTVKNLFTHVFHSCRVMASIKDSSNEAQKKDEPQEVYCVVYFSSLHFMPPVWFRWRRSLYIIFCWSKVWVCGLHILSSSLKET